METPRLKKRIIGSLAERTFEGVGFPHRVRECEACGGAFIAKGWRSHFCEKCRKVKRPTKQFTKNKPFVEDFKRIVLQYNIEIPEEVPGEYEWLWKLFWGVLNQAKTDALSDTKNIGGLTKEAEEWYRQDAVRFILSEKDPERDWFELMCEFCYESPDKIRERVKKKWPTAA